MIATSASTTFGGGFTKDCGNGIGPGEAATLTCDVFGDTATASAVPVPPKN